MFNIDDALLMRAEFCGGYIEPPKDYKCSYYELMNNIEIVVGRIPMLYCENPELAMWQSLLTREVILTGGL